MIWGVSFYSVFNSQAIIEVLYTNDEKQGWIMISHGGRSMTLFFINTALFIHLGGKASRVWERQTVGGRRMETATLTNIFFYYWPHQAIIFKALFSTSFASQVRGTQPEIRWGPLYVTLPQRSAQPLNIATVTDSRLRHTLTVRISREHLHISFLKTHKFSFKHVTASTSFHRCVLCRESLIDGLVNNQYAI